MRLFKTRETCVCTLILLDSTKLKVAEVEQTTEYLIGPNKKEFKKYFQLDFSSFWRHFDTGCFTSYSSGIDECITAYRARQLAYSLGVKP